MALLKHGSKLIKDVVNIDHHEKIRGYHFESPRFKQMIMNDKLQLEMSEKIIVVSVFSLSENSYSYL